MNDFPFSSDNKRYHTYSYALKQKYGCRVARVPLDGGFTCPNRDGTKGYGGCLFCSGEGSGEQITCADKSLLEQFEAYKQKLGKWNTQKYLAYFQAFSGTYAPTERLKNIYNDALNLPDVCGLVIGTRSDCIDESRAKLLAEFNQKTDITVELGLQTIHDETNSRLNRCEKFDDFKTAVSLLKKYNIPVWVHLINGLPYETHEMMIESAKAVAKMDIDGIKIHVLYYMHDTPLAPMYHLAMDRKEYIKTVCDQLEVLPPQMIIGRLTGDAPSDRLLAPIWTKRKREVLNEIDKELARRNSKQGLRFAGNMEEI